MKSEENTRKGKENVSEGDANTLTVMLVLSGLAVGSVRAEVAGAMWALRDEARYGDKLRA